MASETSKSVGFEKHDHGLCLEKAIKAAEAYCDRCNLQFTPLRRKVLEILLEEHGFAHKIERLNAFVACALPDILHSPAFMICRKCDTVVEAQSPSSSFDLSATASATGFEIEQTTLEAKGVCNSCAEMA